MNMKETPIRFFGFFDPVHQGHIEIAKKVCAKTGRPVIFTPLPWISGRISVAKAEHRLALLRIALSGSEYPFSIDDGAIEGNVHPYFEMTKHGAKEDFLITYEDRLCMDAYRPPVCEDNVTAVSISPTSDDVRCLRAFLENDEERAYIEKERLYGVDFVRDHLGYKHEHRLEHSISVARLAYDIAKSNGLPYSGWAYIAGLLHDCAKELSEEESLDLLDETMPELKSIYPKWAYHQFLGAVIAQRDFQIWNPFIVEAICWHATGCAHMSPLAKIIYAADKIEPLRGYDSSSMIEECKKDYEKGFLTVLAANRDYLTEKGYKVDNPSTKECFDFYLGDK